MKHFITTSIVSALMLIMFSNLGWGQLLTEDFTFSGLLTANNWSAHSGAGTNAITTNGISGLTYSGYVGSGIGNAASLTTNGEDDNKGFTSQTTGSLYAAFMVNISAANTAGDYFIHFAQTPITGNVFTERVFAKRDASNNIAFGISKASTSTINYTGFTYSLNTTYLLVIKHTFVSGTTNDNVELFINPVINGVEPSPTISYTDITSADPTNLALICLRQGSASNAPTLRVDGIRVGTSWASVVPSSTPDIALSSPNPSVAAGNITKGTTKNLIYKFSTTISTANATLNSVTFTSGGTYANSDISKFQLWYKSGSDDFNTATQIGSDITTSLGSGSHSFSSLSQSINSGTTGYFYVTTDVQGSATTDNTINVSAITTSNLSFASGNLSGMAYAGNDQTIKAPATSSISISSPNPSVSTGNLTQNTNNNVIYRLDLSVTTADAVITGLQIVTSGNYSASDLTNLKAWYSSDNTFSSGTDICLSTISSPTGPGTQTFSGFTNQTITNGTTGYIFVTADIPCGATYNKNIYVNAITTSDITVLAGSITGTAYNGGTQTISSSTPNDATNFAATSGNAQSVISWTAPTGCYSEIMIVASTGAITTAPAGDGSSYSSGLQPYGNGTSFDGGFVIYRGSVSPQTVTGFSNGTTYNLKIFTRNGTLWSSGVSSSITPSNNKYAHSSINLSTGPWYDAASGGNTVSAPSAGDNVFTNGYVVTVDADASCANLTLTNIASAITINTGITLTVTGYLDCTNTPTVDVVGGAGSIKFTGTGAVIGSNWGASAVFSNITFDPGTGNTATFSKKIKFTDNIIINSGTVSNTVSSEIYTTTSGAGTVTVNSNSTLDLSTASCPIYGSTTTTNPMSSVTVNGTLITVSQVNANTFVIGPNGLFQTSRTGNFYTTSSAPGTLTFGGTYESNGTTQNIPSTTYNNLIISYNGVKTLSGNITVNGTLTLGGTASLSLNSNTLTYGTSSTLEYAGTSAQITTDNEFPNTSGPKNCTINNSNGVTLNSNKVIDGTLTVKSNSIFDAGNYIVSGLGDWDVQSGATIKCANNDGLNGNNTTTGGLSSYSTTANYEFNGTLAQITGLYLPSTVTNLTINNSAGVTLSNDVAVSGVFNLNSGTLTLNGKKLSINGTYTGTGTLSGTSTSTLNIGGTGNLGTINFTSGSELLGNLTMDRTSSGIVAIGNNLNVTSGLTLTNGIINMGTNTLTLGTSVLSTGTLNIVDITSNNSYIMGSLERWIASATDSVVFPLGTLNAYRFATIKYTAAPVGGKLKAIGFDTDPGFNNTSTTIVDGAYTVDRISNQTWWKFLADGVSGGTYDICLGAYNLNGVDNNNNGSFSKLRIVKRVDGAHDWVFSGKHSDATGTKNLPMVKRTNITNGFSEFTITGYSGDGNTLSNAPLPVHLSSFTSSSNKRNITLNWSTVSENNNSGFDVERKSVDGNSWVKTGFVTGNGTTTNASNYSFTDRNLNTGKYKYRLKQIDYNGNYEYFELSGTPEVGVPDKFNISQNYPNPFNPVTKIDLDIPFDSKVSLTLYDVTGREIRNLIGSEMKAGYYTHLFDASSLSSGVYFYRVAMNSAKGNFVSSKKMVLLK